MQVCIDTLKEYGLIVEKDGKLFLKISEAEKTKRKGQRKEKEAIYNIINNINTMNKSYDHTSYFTRGGKEEKRNGQPEDPLYNEEGRNCLPFAPGEETDRNTWIPLRELPEDCRRVVSAWNRLHLKTFYGLYPAVLEKVQRLLLQYDVETVIRGIAFVADSSFLLGRSKYKGFKITLGWLLAPDHFANVLSGKYEDQFDEYDQWLDGEPLPPSLTGEATERLMSREERHQAVEELMNPQTPEKLEAARLLKLK